jgi:hypothetical protein
MTDLNKVDKDNELRHEQVIASELTPNLINIINNTIVTIFPKLNSVDTSYLLKSTCELVYVIGYKFDFLPQTLDDYIYQLTQNDSRDIKTLILMLLPFINDDDEGSKKKILTSFQDLYTKKESESNPDYPKYTYSNLQYNRCIRKDGFLQAERNFHIDHLEHNKKLLFNTISIVCNKLFVNWLDVRPVSLREYQGTMCYIATKRSINEKYYSVWDLTINTDSIKLDPYYFKALPLLDIYQTLAIDLFDKIKNIRWTIYDVLLNARPITMISILNSILPMQTMYHELEWGMMTIKQQSEFSYYWKLFIETVSANRGINKLDANIVQRVLRSICVYFQKYYYQIEKLVKSGLYKKFKFKVKIIEGEVIPEGSENTVPLPSIISAFENTPEEHIYTYIYDCITKLKKTWYGLYLFTSQYNDDRKKQFLHLTNRNIYDVKPLTPGVDLHDHTECNYYAIKAHTDTYGFLYTDGTHFLTLKNIYNFAKSICHYGKDWEPMSLYWGEIDSIDSNNTRKNNFIRQLDANNKEVSEWFRVYRYLKITYGIKDRGTINEYNIWIYQSIKLLLADIVIQSLVSKGCFSFMMATKGLTDKKLVGPDDVYDQLVQQKLSEYVFKKEFNQNWNESYHFINNKQYGDMELIKVVDKSKSISYYSYLQQLQSDSEMTWETLFAQNWISQISFFHHYMNNRVIYITGGTGSGKSTQIPKLLLYALKAIHYKYDGKVCCTAPRRDVVKNNATRIAMELGVPIEQPSLILNKSLKTTNYNIQFRYQDKEETHEPIREDKVDYFIKIVTDGLLLEQLLRNKFLKRTRIQKNKTVFTDTNLYDIIMIDESHEHNANMDLILTLTRQSLIYNNSLKLVIVSATMDEDEPIYRRYYRDINDNRMYPWDFTLWNYNLDRINIDRRLHIAAPGKTTNYKVYDKWLPIPNETLNESIDRVVALAIRVCKEYSTGDVLIFLPGKNQIKKACRLLNSNSNIAKNIIALPYYSEMQAHSKTIITKIDVYVKTLHYKKEDTQLYVEYPDDFKALKINPDSLYNYDRAIIISTDIAEASITFPKLKHVIDTGWSKKAFFDINSRTNLLDLRRINEMSRLQRRGRVGRRSDGYVYYLYAPKDTKDVDSSVRLEITRKDVSQQLFSILDNSKINDTFIESPYDFNYITSGNDLTAFLKQYDTQDDIINVLKKQYCVSGTNIIHRYYGQVTQYDYDQMVEIGNIYKQIDKTNCISIYDVDGSFFLIHPEDDSCSRDIIGNFIKHKNTVTAIPDTSSDKPKYYIISHKIYTAMKQLQELLFVAYIDKSHVFQNITRLASLSKFSTKSHEVNKIFAKQYGGNTDITITKFGTEVMKVYRQITSAGGSYMTTNFTIYDCITYLWARKYGVADMLLKILSIYYSAQGFTNMAYSFMVGRKVQIELKNFNKTYVSNLSDMEVYYNIAELIGKQLTEFINSGSGSSRSKNIEDLISQWYSANDIYELPALKSQNKPQEIFNTLRKIESTGSGINGNPKITEILFGLNKINKCNAFLKNWHNEKMFERLQSWSRKNNINVNCIFWYFMRYCEMDAAVKSVDEVKRQRELGMIRSDEQDVSYDWLDQNIRIGEIHSNKTVNLIKCLIRGWGHQTVVHYKDELYQNIVTPNVLAKIKKTFLYNLPESQLTNNAQFMIYRDITDANTRVDNVASFQDRIVGFENTDEVEYVGAQVYDISILSNVKPEWIVEMNPHIFNLQMLQDRNITQLINSINPKFIERLAFNSDPELIRSSQYIMTSNIEITQHSYNMIGGDMRKLNIEDIKHKTWTLRISFNNNIWLATIKDDVLLIHGNTRLPDSIVKILESRYGDIVII